MQWTRIAGRRYWSAGLVILACGLALVDITIFFPGFLSNDSIDQLTQARGDKPLEDWHPPIMALLWRVLLKLSGGHVGVMLAWQCLLLWVALGMLAIYLYRQTGRRGLSLLPLALGLMPFVINISGVVWKDVQMAVALLLASVLLLVVPRLASGWQRYTVAAAAGLLIVYAVNLRYNALAAALPLLWLLWRALPSEWARYRYTAVGVVVAGCLFLTPLLALVKPVVATHPVASIMLDDIVHIHGTQDIARLKTDKQASQALVAISRRCETRRIPVSVWIGCASEQDLQTITRTHYGDTKRVWLQAIVRHPFRYAGYRLGQYGRLLAPQTAAEAYVWQEGIVPNRYGLTVHDNALSRIVRGYVQFMYNDFGVLFRPYFWLLAGVALAVVAWRRRRQWRHAPYVMALSASGALYILSYLPVVASYDFRYSYWACLTVGVAAILALAD